MDGQTTPTLSGMHQAGAGAGLAAALQSSEPAPRTDGRVGPGSQPHATAGRPLVAVLLSLTFVTGLVDATTYLGLGHVFAANMTGNIVLLGFALGGAGKDISMAASLVSVAGFVGGAGGGGLLARRLEADRHRWVTTSLVLETIGLCLAAAGAALAVSGYLIVAVLALAMGMRNATVRRLGVPDVTTTVLTQTLVGLAADIASGAGSTRVSARRVAAVLAMLVGALAGAFVLGQGLVAPLVLGGSLLALTTAGFAIAGPRHWRPLPTVAPR